ncbi:MAG: AAA family ATPase [Ardenticatenaceae bacterium]
MIKQIRIENYKSIQKLKLSLGRVTVLIGENGCGKSNILEAIALSSASANDKLDNEFLAPRGIRVTEPQFMRSAFDKSTSMQDIKIHLEGDDAAAARVEGAVFNCSLRHDNHPYSKWVNSGQSPTIQETIEYLEKHAAQNGNTLTVSSVLKDLVTRQAHALNLPTFLIYAPDSVALRLFEKEGQIQPLGIHGEGLFKLLKVLSSEENKINEIKEKMQLLGWFEDFQIPQNLSDLENYIRIKDRYLDEELPYFDQNSSNEGFLFLLFYFSLFISEDTPKFFAIDNVDESLNPKLCSQLVREIVTLSKTYDKQVILTTHNPAILDGLNLHDDEQRLFVIYRNKLGHTKARRILKHKPTPGQDPVRLSEAFLRGYIGGLPKSF